MALVFALLAGAVTGIAFDLFSLCALAALLFAASLAIGAKAGLRSDIVMSFGMIVLLQVGFMVGVATRGLVLKPIKTRQPATPNRD